MLTKPKTFADCSLYAKTNAEGFTAEKQIIDFLINGQRINYGDPSFKNIRDNLKSRVNAAVLYRLLQNGGIYFVIAKRELPAAFKIFYSKDPKSPSRHKAIFVDVTGLIYEQGGVFYCKDIDKFSTYLLGVLATYLYYLDNNKLLRNGALQRSSVSAFCKMFGGLLDYLRVSGYIEHRSRILYITGVYFGINVMGLDISTARKVSMVANKLTAQEAQAADYYYVAEDEFTDIETFSNSLINTFKLKGLTVGVLLDRWYFLYGKGTHFALELYPAFLQAILYAYSGTYLNNWKRIEAVTGRDMTDIATTILKIGAESIQRGFSYESADDREYYHSLVEEFDPTKSNVPTQGQTNIVADRNKSNNQSSKPPQKPANTPSINKPVTNSDIQKTVRQNMDELKSAANAAKEQVKAQSKPTPNSKAEEARAKNNDIPATAEEVKKSMNDEKKAMTKGASGSGVNENTECLVKHLEDDLVVPEAGEKKVLFDKIIDDNVMDDALKESLIDDAKKKIKHMTDMKALYKDWAEKSKKFVTHRWIERLISPDQEEMLKKHFDIMNAEDVEYGDYKKSFNQICKFMGLPNKGVVIEWFEIKEDQEGKSGGKKAALRYSKGLEQVTIPDDVHLMHVSPAKEIEGGALRPAFKSKASGKFFYPSKRVFFTVDKEVNIWAAGTVGVKTYKYVTKEKFKTAYIDPACNGPKDRCVYIESDSPIPIERVEDKFRDVKNAIMSKYYQTTRGKQLKDAEAGAKESPRRKISDVKAEIEQKKAEKAAAKEEKKRNEGNKEDKHL